MAATLQDRHVCCVQLANEQAQSLEASLAAEERIQALEQRLASHQESGTPDQAAAGDPPAMAAPGTVATINQSINQSISQSVSLPSVSLGLIWGVNRQ